MDSLENAFSDACLLLLTYRKTEKYIPEVISNLNQFWPHHPQLFVCTDGEFSGPNVLSFKDTSFVELLDRSLREVRQQRPDLKYVFVMLEDLCPLDSVDEAVLAKIYSTLRQRHIRFVSLPWYYAHLLRVVDEENSFNCADSGQRYHLLQPDCKFHCAIVTTIWDVDHLQWILDRKLEQQIHDPWGFEKPVESNPHHHYMVRGVWPIVADGFLHRGNLNKKIFTVRDWPESELLSRLRVEYCGRDSQLLAKVRAHSIAFLIYCRHWPRITAGKLVRALGLKRDKASAQDHV